MRNESIVINEIKTLIYTNGGENYLGEHSEQNISYWKWYGKQKNMKYMYKGYYYRAYIKDTKDIVIVYTLEKWYDGEKAKRKANGFLGIREYKI